MTSFNPQEAFQSLPPELECVVLVSDWLPPSKSTLCLHVFIYSQPSGIKFIIWYSQCCICTFMGMLVLPSKLGLVIFYISSRTDALNPTLINSRLRCNGALHYHSEVKFSKVAADYVIRNTPEVGISALEAEQTLITQARNPICLSTPSKSCGCHSLLATQS